MKVTLFERKIIFACIQSDQFRIKREFCFREEGKATWGANQKSQENKPAQSNVKSKNCL